MLQSIRSAVVVGGVYLALGALSIALNRWLDTSGYLWPADAVAIALLCRLDASRRFGLLAIGLAVLVVNCGIGAAPLVFGFGLAAVHMLEVGLAVWLLRDRLAITFPRIDLEKAVKAFTFGAVLPAAVGAAVAYALFASYFGFAARSNALAWWHSHVMMFTVFAPPILFWSSGTVRKMIAPTRALENVSILLGLLVYVYVVFRFVSFPYVAVSVPLLFVAYRTSPAATAIFGATAVTEILVLWLLGVRPLGSVASSGDAVATLPLIAIACTVLPSLALALSVEERRRIVRALAVSERETQALIADSPIAVGVLPAGSPWLKPNAAFLRLLGRDPAQTEPIRLDSFVHPEDITAGLDDVAAVRSGRRHVARGAWRYLHVDGHIVWVQSAIALHRDAAGDPKHWIVYAESLEERHSNELLLTRERERFRATLEAVSDGVITTDAGGLLTYVNPAALEMLGQTESALIGQPLDHVLTMTSAETGRPRPSLLRRAIQRGERESRIDPCVLHRPDGSMLYVRDSIGPIAREGGIVEGWVVALNDVSVGYQRLLEIRTRADQDALTGLANRSRLLARIDEVLVRARAVPVQAWLLMVDLDRFKQVNDVGGHATGDRMLRRVAECLTVAVRRGDLVARLGGDEFAVLLCHCDAEQAMAIAQRIVASIGDAVVRNEDATFSVGASVGVASLPAAPTDSGAWLAAADEACYRAKDGGRGRAVRLAEVPV